MQQNSHKCHAAITWKARTVKTRSISFLIHSCSTNYVALSMILITSHCLFIGVGASKFWGCEKCLPEFHQTCQKNFCATFAYKFSPTKIMKTFSVWPPKKGFHVLFCKRWVPFFSKKAGRHFCSEFRAFCLNFQRNKTFGDVFAPPALPPPTPLYLSTHTQKSQ